MITDRVGRVDYTYYTVEEAKALGIDFIENWRDAREEDIGRWVLSDTGMVCGPIVNVLDLRVRAISAPYSIVRIPTGTFYGRPGQCLTHEKQANRFSFGGKDPRIAHKDPNRPLSPKERRFVRAFFRFLLEYAHLGPGRELEVVEQAYLAVSRIDPEKSRCWRREARRFSRRMNVERAIDVQLSTVLDEKGVTDEWIIEQLKLLVTKDGGSDHVRLETLKAFARMRGIAGDHEEAHPRGRLVFPGYSNEQIAAGREANAQRSLPPPTETS